MTAAVALGYRAVEGAPTPEEYVRLRAEAGLSPKTPVQAAAAIAGTWRFRHVRAASGEAVAMGRVIGDGGWYFLIADMATLPPHQGRGLGSGLLDALLGDVRAAAPPGALVTLLADPPGRRLYASRGFRDSAPGSVGMLLVLD